MRLNAFDLPPTGNEIIDELRIVGAAAVTIPEPEAQKNFIAERAAEIPSPVLADSQFLVMGRQVMLKSLAVTDSRPVYERAMFTARYAMWNLLLPRGGDSLIMTIDIYDTDLAGTDPEDRGLISQLIAQVPILGIDVFIETAEDD